MNKNEKWEQRFAASLAKAKIVRESPPDGLLGFIAKQCWMENPVWELAAAAERTQSPIEEAMLFALALAARSIGGQVRLCFREDGRPASALLFKEFNPCGGFESRVSIELQKPIGRYAADFFLRFSSYIDPKNIPAFVTEQNPGAEFFAVQELVLECDGHDFHERTKEQARHDRERDRKLQDAGYRVHRYTGSEIWEDVFACALAAIESIRRLEDKRLRVVTKMPAR